MRASTIFPAAIFAFVLGAVTPAAAATSSLAAAAQRYLDEAVQRDPLYADSVGIHTEDDRLADYSAASNAADHAWLAGWRARFAAIDPASLSPDDRADRQCMLDNIDAQLLEDDALKPDQTDPTLYVGAIGDAAYQLTSRQYAPLDVRLRHVANRMRLIPRIVREAEANLTNPPPATTQIAISQNAGNIDFYEGDVAGMARSASPATRAAVEAAMPKVIASLQEFGRFLTGPLMRRSNGNPRVGAAVFDRELRLVDGTDTPRTVLVARARADFEATRQRMYRLALPLDRAMFPGRAHAQRGDALINAVVGEVLDKLADDHPDRDHIFSTAKADVSNLMAFLQKDPVVPLPVPDTLHVVPTPPFLAGFAGAGLDPPGPFTPLAGSYYDIDLIPKNWSAARVASYLRDNNDYELQILSTHEAVPGHYVQFRYDALTPSLVRRVWPNGSFVEGWAVYTEGMMEDAGYGGGDPRLRLFQLKWRLREYANTIIDAQFHTGTLAEDQCVGFLMRDAFQERSQALTKWNRLELSHDQLSTYFVGLDAIQQAENAFRASQGTRFRIAAFNARLLHMGSVEPRFIAQMLNAP